MSAVSGLASLEAQGGPRGRVAGALREARRAGRLGHAYLIAGPTGSGKAELASALAAARLCVEAHADATGSGCGSCRSCRLVAQGTHPDLLRVVEGEGRGVPIEAVRELIADLALCPVEGPARVAVIDPAERLAEAAASALLKTLEEPPEGALLVLLSARPDLLLPTIRSRCMRIRLPPPGSAGLDADPRAERIREAALVLADPRQGDPYDRAERALAAIEGAAEDDPATRTPTEKRRRAALAVLDHLLGRLRGRVREHARAGRSIGRLEAAAARVLETCEAIEGNAVLLLALEVLATDLDRLAGRRPAAPAPAPARSGRP